MTGHVNVDPANRNLGTPIYWKDPYTSIRLPPLNDGAWLIAVSSVGLNNLGDACNQTGGEAAYWHQHSTVEMLPGAHWKNEALCRDLNDAGTKIGTSVLPASFRATRWDSSNHPHNLGALGDATSSSDALGISPSGIIVGSSETTSEGSPTHAVLWNGDGITDLGTLGGPSSVAYAVNDAGQIVGGADLSTMVNGSAVRRAVLWQGGVPQDLNTVSGQIHSEAYSINASGLIVGASWTNTKRATLWDHGTNIDLQHLLAPQVSSTHQLNVGASINDGGYILITGTNTSTGKQINYLATPVSPTHVTLTSSPSPSFLGQTVTFMAKVSADYGGTPVSAITFKDGSTVLGSGSMTVQGVATFKTSSLDVGTHSITANFSGYIPFGYSVSPVLSQVVKPFVIGAAPAPAH